MDWNLATLLTKVLKKHFKILQLIEKSFVTEFDSRRKISLKWRKYSIADPSESFFWDSPLVVILKWILTINCGIKYRSTFDTEVLQRLKLKWQVLNCTLYNLKIHPFAILWRKPKCIHDKGEFLCKYNGWQTFKVIWLHSGRVHANGLPVHSAWI